MPHRTQLIRMFDQMHLAKSVYRKVFLFPYKLVLGMLYMLKTEHLGKISPFYQKLWTICGLINPMFHILQYPYVS